MYFICLVCQNVQKLIYIYGSIIIQIIINNNSEEINRRPLAELRFSRPPDKLVNIWDVEGDHRSSDHTDMLSQTHPIQAAVISVTLHTLLQYLPPPDTQKDLPPVLNVTSSLSAVASCAAANMGSKPDVHSNLSLCCHSHTLYFNVNMSLKQTLYSYTQVCICSVSRLALVLLTSTEAIAMIYCMHNL